MIPVLCAAFVLMAVFYLLFERMKDTPDNNSPKHIFIKCAATSMAVLAALLGCLKSGTAAHLIMLAGLTVCAAADGVLCVHFLAGGGLFALGHILYMAAFLVMRRPTWLSAVIFLVLMVPSAAVFIRFRGRIGPKFPFFCAYAAVLSAMVALSSVQHPLYFAGALLFAFSDALLAYLLSGGKSAALDRISLGAYYLGQFLLGLAVFVT